MKMQREKSEVEGSLKMSRSWAAEFRFRRGKITQVEGTACAKAQNFERMVPWHFMELVISLVCPEQRIIEVILLITLT